MKKLCYNLGVDNVSEENMSTPVSIYQMLVDQYTRLRWYQKVGFWLSAPRLAWDLFGYRKNPDENRVNQLIQWAKTSWFFKKKFEQDIFKVVEPAVYLDFHDNEPPSKTNDTVLTAAEHRVDGADSATLTFHRDANPGKQQNITKYFLLAVAYGMESETVNCPVKASDAGNLFKSHLFAKELLYLSPMKRWRAGMMLKPHFVTRAVYM